MIEELLQQEEGKTLEFKENSKSLDRIIPQSSLLQILQVARFSLGSGIRQKRLLGCKILLKRKCGSQMLLQIL
jgi:hypothetical protein